MYRNFIVILLTGLAFENVSAKWPEFETTADTDFLYNQKQVFYERKGRFIKFDTKDSEMEVELGISIPFLKIPLRTEFAKHSGHEAAKEAKISINAAGLIVAGVLMLTSFLVVPLIFTKTTFKSLGLARSLNEDGEIWRALQGVNNLLSENNINSTSCAEKAVCWIAKTSKGGKDGSIGQKIDQLLGTWWATRLMEGTLVDEAVKRGRTEEKCSAYYRNCPLTQQHLKAAIDAFASHFRK